MITGVTGQDGSYLAELLLEKGYEVRRSSTFNTSGVDRLYADPRETGARLRLHHADLTDGSGLVNLLHEVRPYEVYHLAAQSHVKVSFETFHFTGDVTGLGTTRLLKRFARQAPNAACTRRRRQRSSARRRRRRMICPRWPRSPYGVAKVYGTASRGTTPRRTGCTPSTAFCSIMSRPAVGRPL